VDGQLDAAPRSGGETRANHKRATAGSRLVRSFVVCARLVAACEAGRPRRAAVAPRTSRRFRMHHWPRRQP